MTEIINGKLRMTSDRLLVAPLDWDHGCKHIIAIRHGDPVRGIVREVGPGHNPVCKRTNFKRDGNQMQRIEFSKRFRPTEVKVGDIIELGGLNIFDGKGYPIVQDVIYNGEYCIIIQERSVACVRDDLKDSAA